jgi:hypothetical protein
VCGKGQWSREVQRLKNELEGSQRLLQQLIRRIETFNNPPGIYLIYSCRRHISTSQTQSYK